MRQIEEKMANLRRRYAQLHDAQTRINAELSGANAAPAVNLMRTEIALIKIACNQAMKALEVELSEMQSRGT